MKNIDLIKLILPEDFTEFFDLVDFKEENGHIHLYLDEKAVQPFEHSDKDLE